MCFFSSLSFGTGAISAKTLRLLRALTESLFSAASASSLAVPQNRKHLSLSLRQGTKSSVQLEAEVAKERYEDRLAELEA